MPISLDELYYASDIEYQNITADIADISINESKGLTQWSKKNLLFTVAFGFNNKIDAINKKHIDSIDMNDCFYALIIDKPNNYCSKLLWLAFKNKSYSSFPNVCEIYIQNDEYIEKYDYLKNIVDYIKNLMPIKTLENNKISKIFIDDHKNINMRIDSKSFKMYIDIDKFYKFMSWIRIDIVGNMNRIAYVFGYQDIFSYAGDEYNNSRANIYFIYYYMHGLAFKFQVVMTMYFINKTLLDKKQLNKTETLLQARLELCLDTVSKMNSLDYKYINENVSKYNDHFNNKINIYTISTDPVEL